MDEKELNQKLYDMFKEMLLVLENSKQGFLTENEKLLTESETRLTGILTSNLPFTEEIVKKISKDKLEKKYLTLLPHLQLMAATVRNLIDQEKQKVGSGVLFTEKAVNEIRELHTLIQTQFQDATDYILTRNPRLKTTIKGEMEKLFKAAEQHATEHEVRLITGLCMAKASFLYLAIVDCIKRVSRELTNFTEEL
jgi:Na+/phosphate symporter